MGPNQAARLIYEKAGPRVKVATPLGLGKPNLLLNELYDLAAQDPSLRLDIYTALSLTPPSSGEELGRRFLAPFAERQWGDYPELKYFANAVRDALPANVGVHEFYFQSGLALKSKHLQRNYQSVNYTHAAANVLRSGVSVIVQMVARHGDRYSLSCNPDLTLDLVDLYHKNSRPLLVVGVVHRDLPYLEGETEVTESFFDVVVDGGDDELFALPREPVSLQDHCIGLHASRLVADGGTLQVGIGSLSEALGAALVRRHCDGSAYVGFMPMLQDFFPLPSSIHAEDGVFTRGLYGLSEMVTDVFMHLRRAGILKREVVDETTGARTYLHGAFYLGSKEFYRWLRELSIEDARGFRMTRVSKVNDLYDPQEILLRRQRVGARFFNTSMQVSLLGEAISETLSDGHVVSGIGGQYNFVSMAMELEDARSILLLRSTHAGSGGLTSSIVWSSGRVSIPRHLRDLVVTEYGVADVRGKSDEETIAALLCIADSRFQPALLAQAKKADKIDEDYEIPEAHRRNFPARLEELRALDASFFEPFPFGSDFTTEEERIAVALQELLADSKESKWKVLKAVFGGSGSADGFVPELKRMGLAKPHTLSDRWNRRLLLTYLARRFPVLPGRTRATKESRVPTPTNS